MTAEEKVAAFDLLAVALTNCWHDGRWSWWCCSPCGGSPVATQPEAVASLVEWAGRVVELKRKRGQVPLTPLGRVAAPPRGSDRDTTGPAECGNGPPPGPPAAGAADDAPRPAPA